MNSRPSFRVYVDESGEEGFVFRPDGGGSSRWLILSAVVARRENDLAVVALMRKVRALLARTPDQPLHFVKLDHSQRIPWVREIGLTPLRTVSVLVQQTLDRRAGEVPIAETPSLPLRVPDVAGARSWLCRDNRKEGMAMDGPSSFSRTADKCPMMNCATTCAA